MAGYPKFSLCTPLLRGCVLRTDPDERRPDDGAAEVLSAEVLRTIDEKRSPWRCHRCCTPRWTPPNSDTRGLSTIVAVSRAHVCPVDGSKAIAYRGCVQSGRCFVKIGWRLHVDHVTDLWQRHELM